MPETHDDVRDEYRFKCPRCESGFSGDDLSTIFKRAARHWNKEHGSELSSTYDRVDEVEIGGHHITGNSYEIRKYTVYLTAFDMADRLGKVDGWLIPEGDDYVCPECFHRIPDEDDRIEDDLEFSFVDEWMCRACVREAEIERKRSENQNITEIGRASCRERV